eukprot:2251229-Karenia_brevis.AAC.1
MKNISCIGCVRTANTKHFVKACSGLPASPVPRSMPVRSCALFVLWCLPAGFPGVWLNPSLTLVLLSCLDTTSLTW